MTKVNIGRIAAAVTSSVDAAVRRHALALSLISVFASAWCLQLCLFREVWQNYQPSNDDIGLLVHSTAVGGLPFMERLQSWFGEGFSNYWYIYPDWTLPHTDYLRPGVNIAFMVLFEMLGTAWWLWLPACYALYALVLVLVVDTAYQTYRLRGWPLVFAGIATALTPAAWFEGELFFHPTFAFDAVVAGLILIAFRASRARRYGLLVMVLAIAVFTKETALAAAAAATCGVTLHEWRRHRRHALLLGIAVATPALLWLLARWMAFGGDIGVGVASAEAHSPLLHLMRELLEWPFNDGQLNPETVAAIRQRDFSQLPLALMLQLAANLGFLLVVAWTVLRQWRQYRRGEEIAGPVVWDTMLWLSWLTALLMLTSVTPRIGLAAYLMAMLLIARSTQRASTVWLRRTAVTVAVLILAISLETCLSFFHGAAIETNVERSRNQQALHALLRRDAADGRTLLVVNDFSSRFVTNDDLVRFLAIPGRVQRISSIEYVDEHIGASPNVHASHPYVFERDGEHLHIETALLPGYQYRFEDADPDLLREAIVADRAGASGCRYRFPDHLMVARQPVQLGLRMVADCHIEGDVRIIFYDAAERRYRDEGRDLTSRDARLNLRRPTADDGWSIDTPVTASH